MSFQQSGLKENIHLSEETAELIESLALLLHVPLTSSQLSICVELLQKGVSHRSLVDAITRYSGKNHVDFFSAFSAILSKYISSISHNIKQILSKQTIVC
uniref:Mitotic-spindle organizing protein associated with a ring of gamma-tubulin 1 n=1 Tax=Loa loa TaxID=7209 RepID=A0A1I7VPK2_LOALO